MKVLSLFDGISCGMFALERDVAFEIDENAIKTSQNQGYDLLIGGSPCHPFDITQRNGKGEKKE